MGVQTRGIRHRTDLRHHPLQRYHHRYDAQCNAAIPHTPRRRRAQPTLTLKDATITSSFNQLFHILAGAKLTLRIEGDNRIEIDNSLIWNLGTLTLIVADALEISQGIDNGFYNGG